MSSMPIFLKNSLATRLCVLLIPLLYVGLWPLLSHGQGCNVVLRIQDATDGIPLAFATVTYRPDGGNIKAGFTDAEGLFQYKMADATPMDIRVTYLGYEPYEGSINCGSGERIISMRRSAFQLKEVVVTDRLPKIVEKQDTVVYDVSQFANGQEWKLREILAKLPGIEVTHDNQVLYKGERVEEMLVEGQTFFTGDAALAVRYIPADAVDKVQVLERHNAVASLQGSGINDKLALNIQLKPERRKLLFGDVLAGTNVKARHTLHSNLFRYQPRASINHIGDFNTTEQEALTNGEMIRLTGMKLTGYDPRGGISDGVMEQLALLVAPQRVFARQSLFTINQLRQQLPRNAGLNAILMWTDKEEHTSMDISTDYIAARTREFAQRASEARTGRLMAKTTLTTDNSKPNHISYEFHLARRTQRGFAGADVVFNEQNSRSAELRDGYNTAVQNELTTILKHSERWQSIFQARMRHNREWLETTWDVAGGWRPIFYASDADTFQLNQTSPGKTTEYALLWRLNHTLGKRGRAYFFIRHSQRTDEADANAFFSAPGEGHRSLLPLGVGYTQRLETSELSMGGRFLFKKKDFELQLGMDYLAPQWNEVAVQGERKTEKRPAPVLELSGLIRGVGRVRLSYGYDILPPRRAQLFDGLQLRHFNQLQRGVPDLLASRTHNTALHFSRSNLIKGRVLSASAVYMYTNHPLLTNYLPSRNALLEMQFNGLKAREDMIATLAAQWFKRELRITSRIRYLQIHFQQDQSGNGLQLFRQRTLMHTMTFAREWKRMEVNVANSLTVGHVPTAHTPLDWYTDNRLSVSLHRRFGEQWRANFSTEFNRVNTVTIRGGNINLSCDLRYAILKGKYIFAFRAHNLLNQRLIPENHTTAFLNRNILHAAMPRFVMFSVTRVF
jgi:hypothetical protein